MDELKMKSCILRYTLIAQTPLIHFQHDQTGATLRATEVKPKLDAFLRNAAQKDSIDTHKMGWHIKDTKALNYKMRFFAESAQSFLPPKIYYGNMGIKNEKEKAYCIMGNCRMEIICNIPALAAIIDRHIAEFFICTNFGRMQNKGFGGFTVDGRSLASDEIAKALADHAGAMHCYAISGFSAHDTTSIFNAIATIYSVMKSGVNHTGFGGSYHRSYLFEYCYENMKIGNEKAAMKKEGVSPWKDGEPLRHPLNRRNFWEQDHEPRYVRAILGTGEKIEYIADFQQKPDKYGNMKWSPAIKERIDISNSDIERLASPIFFKVINGTIYMVAKRIDSHIFGKTFTFTNAKTKESLQLPVPEHFDIDAFLDYFVRRYNTDSKQKERNGKPVSYSIGKSIDTVYTAQGGNC